MSTLLMDFQVDKSSNRIFVKREFAAPVDQVWAAWTQAELLNQWWAPQPWKAKTKDMNFVEGGRWLYSMVGPEGEEHWSIAEYKTIEPKKFFEGLDAFCDADGHINDELPRTKWIVKFSSQGEHTLVDIVNEHQSLKDLETTLEMGFKEGFTMGLGNLDELLDK